MSGVNHNFRAQCRDSWLLLMKWLRQEHQNAWVRITAPPPTTSPRTNCLIASVCALKMEAMVTASGSDGEGGGGSSLELVSAWHLAQQRALAILSFKHLD